MKKNYITMKFNIKNIIVFLLKVLSVVILLNNLISFTDFYKNISSVKYFNESFKTVFIFQNSKDRIFSFSKLLSLLSIYLLLDLEIIMHSSYLASYFFKIILFNSKNKANFFRNKLIISKNIIIKNNLNWVSCIIIWFVLFNIKKGIMNISIFLFLEIILFLIINNFINILVILYSKHPTYSIVILISKIFIYAVAYNRIYIIFIILLISLFLFYKKEFNTENGN